MAGFLGAAAQTKDNLRHAARILRSKDYRLTPSEQKGVADAVDFGLDAQEAVTRFLAEAPAESVLKCHCEGCGHVRDHLEQLRKIAGRAAHKPVPDEHKVLPSR